MATSSESRVSVTLKGHGTYSCHPSTLDLMIEKYLPASPRHLRAVCEEQSALDLSDVVDVSAFLVMLGEWQEGEWKL